MLPVAGFCAEISSFWFVSKDFSETRSLRLLTLDLSEGLSLRPLIISSALTRAPSFSPISLASAASFLLSFKSKILLVVPIFSFRLDSISLSLAT